MKTILNNLKWLLCSLVFVLSFTACEDDPNPVPVPNPPVGRNGVFILCEGSWTNNNSGISYYDFATKTTTRDILNGTLGDTGNDMILYGNKLYVTVSTSGVIFVINPETKQVIKKVEVKDGKGTGRLVRRLAAYEGKVYATILDGYVMRLDTTTLTVEAETKVGPNPEGIAACSGKLYVANSGGSLAPTYNNTLSIVNIASFHEERTVIVGVNPDIVQSDENGGNIYLSYRGNYDNTKPNYVKPGIQRISNGVVEDPKYPINVEKFVISNQMCIYYGFDYNTNTANYGMFGLRNEYSRSDLISDGTTINIPYGIGINPSNGDIYISDTDYENPGKVYIFDFNNGVKKFEITGVGISPSKFVFY